MPFPDCNAERIRFQDRGKRWILGTARLEAWTTKEIKELIESNKDKYGRVGHAEVFNHIYYFSRKSLLVQQT